MSNAQSPLLRLGFVVPAALMLLALAAAIAWYAVNVETRPLDNTTQRSERSGSLVFSTRDIERGEVLLPADVATRPMKGAEIPQGSLRNVSDAVGRVALRAITSGALIHSSQVTPGPVPGISRRVPVGYRAYAVAVSDATISGGFLQAGDRVDLYVTLPGGLFANSSGINHGQNDQSKGVLLLQSVEVLAVGTKTQAGDDANTSARTVTLALQADVLPKTALAARLGNISFAIRNPTDEGQTATAPVDIDALQVMLPPPAAKTGVSSKSNAAGVIIYSGRDRSSVRAP